MRPLRVRHNRISCTSGLPNWAEEGRKTREVNAIFEVVACLACPNEETQSMIEEVGDDMAALVHVSKQIKLGHEGNEFPNERPKGIHWVAKSTTEDRMGRSEMKYSTGSENPDESSAEMLALLSRNVKDFMGNVDSLRDEFKR